MDLKITDFDIVTEKILLNQTAEIPVESDLTLADYQNNIKKILKCKITPYINSKEINGNTLSVEGTTVTELIYCDNEGTIFSAENETSFKKSFEATKTIETENTEIALSASCHSCKAITEKRVSIKGSVKLEVKAYFFEKEQIISDIENDHLELLQGEINTITPMGTASKNLIIEEELMLPQNMPEIKHIIRNETYSTISDCKIISNKVILKGVLKIIIIYCSMENMIKKHTTEIPFNQILDMPNITEDCECEAYSKICGINILAQASSNGEKRRFILTGKLQITAKAFCNSNVPVIFDAYSTRNKLITEKKEISFFKTENQINETFICSKKLSLPDGCSEKILDLWCCKNNCHTKLNQNNISINGGISVYIITTDDNSEPIFLERNIDFEYPISINNIAFENCKCNPKTEILSYSFSPVGNKEIEIKLELNIKATIYSTLKSNLITSVTIDESTNLNTSSSIIAYYADAGESIWNICKNFSANLKETNELNNINNDILPAPKILLIPCM